VATRDVEIRHLSPEPYACIAASTTPAGVSKELRRILPEIGRYIQRHGLQAIGQPLSRYYRYDAAGVEMDAGIRVAGGAEGDGAVEIRELPGGDVACAVHVGPYTTLKETYDDLERWIAQRGRAPRDAPWEVYVTDPGAEPDSSRWETEIYWPV
jgi:AraC family transcriptional regulator